MSMANQPKLDYEQLPVTLHPSRVRYSLLSLFCVVFCAIGIGMIHEGANLLMGSFIAIFFGAGAIVLLVSLHPRASYLTLTPDGFLVCSLFRESFTPWSAVLGFGVISIRSTRMVAYDFVPDYPKSQAMRSLSRSLADFEAALPTTYGMKAAHLAEQMNGLLLDYRVRHPQTPFVQTLQFDKAQ
jgi:hypothetical protein